MNQKKRGRKKDGTGRVSMSFAPDQIAFLDAVADAVSNGRDTRPFTKHPALPDLAIVVHRAKMRTGQPTASDQPVAEEDDGVVQILELCTPSDLVLVDYVVNKLLAGCDASIVSRKPGFPALAKRVRAKREALGLLPLKGAEPERARAEPEQLASTG